MQLDQSKMGRGLSRTELDLSIRDFTHSYTEERKRALLIHAREPPYLEREFFGLERDGKIRRSKALLSASR